MCSNQANIRSRLNQSQIKLAAFRQLPHVQWSSQFTELPLSVANQTGSFPTASACAVIKPIYGAASIGVVRVDSEEQLEKTYIRVQEEMAGAKIVDGALVQGSNPSEGGKAGGWIQTTLMLEEYLVTSLSGISPVLYLPFDAVSGFKRRWCWKNIWWDFLRVFRLPIWILSQWIQTTLMLEEFLVRLFLRVIFPVLPFPSDFESVDPDHADAGRSFGEIISPGDFPGPSLAVWFWVSGSRPRWCWKNFWWDYFSGWFSRSFPCRLILSQWIQTTLMLEEYLVYPGFPPSLFPWSFDSEGLKSDDGGAKALKS
jgi:hypothetical protein